MNLAFAYIRRSSYKQQENNSVEIQKANIIEYASRNGLEVPDEFIFIEDVTSAYSKRAGKRKELMRMLDMMVETNTPRVIFYEESRMDRTGYSFVLEFYYPLKKQMADAKIFTTNSEGPFDPDDPQTQLMLLLHLKESEIKSERAIGSLISDLENEDILRPGAKVPFGYDQKNKKLVPNHNADIVTFIYFLQSWGMSMERIAETLNEASIPSSQGKQWRSSSIEKILKNPVYTGTIVWNVKKSLRNETYMFEDSHEPLIDRFIVHLSENNIQLQKKYGRLDTPFLFLNKIKCSHCNNKLTTHNGSTTRKEKKYHYQYYVCKSCNYKLEINDLHNRLIPKVLKHVQDYVSAETIKDVTLQNLQETNQIITDNINKTQITLDKLAAKGCIAKEHGDREYEKMIEKLYSKHHAALEAFRKSQDILHDLLEMVQSDMFFNRFYSILDSQLADNEKRLIILYFVDTVLSSTDEPLKVLYHNVFDSFDFASNG